MTIILDRLVAQAEKYISLVPSLCCRCVVYSPTRDDIHRANRFLLPLRVNIRDSV